MPLNLKQLGEIVHQSAIILTSREKPAEIATLEGETLPVRTFWLQGLSENEARTIFKAKGLLGSQIYCDRLNQLYQGNPLALKIVGTTIKDIFAGKISDFLAQKTVIFNGIRILLEQQFQRLSNLEQELMYWLAINREPISISELRSDLVSPTSTQKLLEALESLRRRSLLESIAHKFTLQPVVMEYVTTNLIERVVEEITNKNLDILNTHALIKAQSKNYLRNS